MTAEKLSSLSAMGSRPGLNISLFLIIASMSMLASSNTVPQEMPYDFPTCLEAVKGCFYEIHQFKRGFLSGVVPEPGSGLIGPACCAAIMEIHEKCWFFICPDPFFTPQLQNYCTRQSQMAPGPNPDTPLAPGPDPDPDTPSQAPSVDPPAPAPKDDPPAPAPEDDPPAPSVDPPAPAPAPAPKDDPPAPKPAPKDDPPAPAPAPKDDPPVPAPSCIPRRHHHHGGGDLSEKWFCT
nr:PREDICTED: wiskott-Aldrich syndrome protein family member 2-like [Daucus carota subsp. sativus]